MESVYEAQLALAQPDCCSLQIVLNCMRLKPCESDGILHQARKQEVRMSSVEIYMSTQNCCVCGAVTLSSASLVSVPHPVPTAVRESVCILSFFVT